MLSAELKTVTTAKEAAENECVDLQRDAIHAAAEALKLMKAFKAKERALMASQSALEEEYSGKMGVAQNYGRTLAQKARDLDLREAALRAREKKMSSTELALASSQARIEELEAENRRLQSETLTHSMPAISAAAEELGSQHLSAKTALSVSAIDADEYRDDLLRRRDQLARALHVTEGLIAGEIAAAEEREALRVELDKHIGHAEATATAAAEVTEALSVDLDKHAGHAAASEAAAALQTEALRVELDKHVGHIDASAAAAAADRAAADSDRNEIHLLVSKHTEQAARDAATAPTMPAPLSSPGLFDADPTINPAGGAAELAVSASAAIAVPDAQANALTRQLEALQKERATKNEQIAALQQQLAEAIETNRNQSRVTLMLMQTSLPMPPVQMVPQAIPLAASASSLGTLDREGSTSPARAGFFSGRRASASSLPPPSERQAVTPGMPLM